MGERVVSDD
ncbi:hypothetical protein XAC3218_910194 [Xanthomonas citri pv. citri]|uniref:Uncharacterized protein n=1 Tax=Xanthomonas citri pv. citri TaxID=611301 RepID=A0A0U5BXY7_XANCI|nr:hypothetical protein XAC902_1040248 [Xanthomonas citri pv. citri]CEE21379.1 hypothetical protein XAC908_1050081 [Xanthomonas citri pv. citri]CEE38379.1 hypothetical protein XAC3824_880242 [Xanthomonas citri pv. citri]CEE48629.1 hypothetical protein XAC2911_790246 [Xanthomonas citri pv. citri]CEE52812.1 hypothetical protein XACS584_1220086 [Xanthomonas citri pv. citri]